MDNISITISRNSTTETLFMPGVNIHVSLTEQQMDAVNFRMVFFLFFFPKKSYFHPHWCKYDQSATAESLWLLEFWLDAQKNTGTWIWNHKMLPSTKERLWYSLQALRVWGIGLVVVIKTPKTKHKHQTKQLLKKQLFMWTTDACSKKCS